MQRKQRIHVLAVLICVLVCSGFLMAEPRKIADWPGFLDQVRAKALTYVDGLPNFICSQKLQRHALFSQDVRVILDEVLAELSFYGKSEHVRILTVGGKKAPSEDPESIVGMISRGEFGNSLQSLFDPSTRAKSELDGFEKIRGRETVRIRYSVAKETSRNAISIGGEEVVTAYRGRCWVDRENRQVVRLEDMAVDIPGGYPATHSSSRTEFGSVDIDGQEYWLPISASVKLVARTRSASGKSYNFYRQLAGAVGLPNFHPPQVEAVNVITYSDYHKFETKVKISF